jgi:hypothetical protein
MGRLGEKINNISIPGKEILDSDWLTAIHYLSIIVHRMMIVCLRDEQNAKRQFSRHKSAFSTHKLYKCTTSKKNRNDVI